MFFKSSLGLCLYLFAISSFAAVPPAVPKNADDLIAEYFEACRGYTRIESLHTLRTKGVLTENGTEIGLEIEKQRPNFLRITWRVGEQSGGEGFDGASWELSANGKVTRTEGIPAAATRHAADFDDYFIDYRKRKIEVEFLGLQKLGQEEVYGLKAVLSDGFGKIYYFDPQTFLVRASRVLAPIHARGKNVDMVEFRENYRTVEGFQLPFSSFVRNMETGKILSTFRTDNIEVNPKIDSARFSPPQQP